MGPLPRRSGALRAPEEGRIDNFEVERRFACPYWRGWYIFPSPVERVARINEAGQVRASYGSRGALSVL